MTNEQNTEGRMLRLPEVMKLTGLSQPTLWRLENAGKFPAKRRITSRSVAWDAREVEEWLTNRPKVA